MSGALIMNADDWGRDVVTTNRTLDCIRAGGVSSVSAMVFMQDSERAAALAGEHAIDSGLHLNLTTPFSSSTCPSAIRQQQEKISRFLGRRRFTQALFHPGLMAAFSFVVRAQCDEYHRLYGRYPDRVDGHHHMHLSLNVILQDLLPHGTLVRRNFSFEAGEKSIWNRYYRRTVDSLLARHHRMTDYFFSLIPLQPESRLQRILSLSHRHIVEVEVHPVNQDEYEFLTGKGIERLGGNVTVGPPSAIRWSCVDDRTSPEG